MGNYISAESYSDYAIGKFIGQLKADGIWDDSIVIIYGDHTAMNENTLSGQDARAAKRLLGPRLLGGGPSACAADHPPARVRREPSS